MSLCDRILEVLESAKKLPDSPEKVAHVEQLERLVSVTEKHEEGDKAVSDQFHAVCQDCQRLILENSTLKREVGRLREGQS